MAHPVVIRVAKHTTRRSLQGVGRHQWREIDTPNADAERTPANEDWRPVRSSDALMAAVDARIDTVTEKVTPGRSVLALEYVITANHAAFREHGGDVDSTAYFRDALAWLERKHGAENVVAVNIQRDELAPHMVAFVVPLVDTEAKTRRRSVIVGKNPDGTRRRETRIEHQEAGRRLSASHFVDGPDKLRQMQTEFAQVVGHRHGLERGVEGSRATHQTVREHYAALARQPKAPSIDVPDPTIADRINPKAYGERVAQAVIDQIQPERSALQARAATAEADRRRSAEMAATAKAAQAKVAAVEPVLQLGKKRPDLQQKLVATATEWDARVTAQRGEKSQAKARQNPAPDRGKGPER